MSKKAIAGPTMTPEEEAAWVEMARTRKLRALLESPRYAEELARLAQGDRV